MSTPTLMPMNPSQKNITLRIDLEVSPADLAVLGRAQGKALASQRDVTTFVRELATRAFAKMKEHRRHPHLEKYLDYIKAVGENCTIIQFDEDWEPVGLVSGRR